MVSKRFKIITVFSFYLLFLSPTFASLTDDITNLLDSKSPPHTKWGIVIENKQDGKLMYESHPNDLMIPASNMKIVSGAAALLGLGPDFQYETTLYRTGVFIDGKNTGNLIVVGTGDPSIGGRFNGGDITELFRQWADVLKQRNIKTITGDLVGVDHAFDRERYGLNWNPQDYVEWYAAEISALSLNDACIDLIITGASKAGNKAKIVLNPPTKYIKINNQMRTVSKVNEQRMVEYVREPGSNHLTVRGALKTNLNLRDYASVPNPALFFLTVLKETLTKEGIKIQGEIRVAEPDNFALKQERWYELAKHKSLPFSELLSVCMHNSQNLYSEHFLKTLGFRGFGKGSWSTGVLVMKDLFFMNGCPQIDSQFIGDGSGLSRDNRISARALVNILRCVDQSEHANVFRDSLPQAGISGTLKSRMKDSAAYQNVWAKTGTLKGVRALSGYIKASSGKEFIFSMLANGTDSGNIFNVIMDEACALIVEQG